MASNFVNENGDIAVLDNIETIYESDPAECDQATTGAGGTGHSIRKSTDGPDQTASETRSSPQPSGGGGGAGVNTGEIEALGSSAGGDKGPLGGGGVGAGNEVNGNFLYTLHVLHLSGVTTISGFF